MESDKAHGERVAGRIIYETEAVGVLAVIFSAFAIVELDGPEQWYAVAAFLFVAAVAFGLLANAVLRK